MKNFSIENGSNVLLMGTGPSVFYQYKNICKYIREVNPVIIGINGALHGLLSLSAKSHHTINPDGNEMEVDMSNSDEFKKVLPHVLFSFLLRADKNDIYGNRIYDDRKRLKMKSDLFKFFILNHKKDIIENNIVLMCPDDRSFKINKVKKKYGYKRYGQAKWNYSNYHEFSVFPPGYRRGLKSRFKFENPTSVENLFCKGNIQFKVRHGGEYVLCWCLDNFPKTIAIVGLCDFPNNAKEKMERGWFWIEKKKAMPQRIGTNQTKIINFIKKKYNKNFIDLNWSPI